MYKTLFGSLSKNYFSRLVQRKAFKPKPISTENQIQEQQDKKEIKIENQQTNDTNIQDQTSKKSKKQRQALTFNEKKKRLEQQKAGRIYDKIRKRDDLLAMMDKCNLQLPLNVLNKCRTVFSKFSAQEVREMGINYLKIYQLSHANERPFNFSTVKNLDQIPFVNTEQILQYNENIRSDKIILKKDSKQENFNPKYEQLVKLQNDLKSSGYQKMGMMYNIEMAIGFLYRKYPGSYAVAYKIINELKKRLGNDFEPKYILDYGAGLGSGTLACLQLFNNYQEGHNADENAKIFSIEPATPMRKLLKHLLKDYEDDVIVLDNLSKSINYKMHQHQFDLVYCGFVFEELVNHEQRMHLAQALWHKTKDNGYLVFVEPGTPKGFRFVHHFRQFIIQQANGIIIAPCPHMDKCPMADRVEWCHFQLSYPNYSKKIFPGKKYKNILKEKYSYMVFQKIKKGEDVQIKYENLQQTNKTFKWARILKPVMKKGGHRIIDICSLDAEFRRIVVSKSQGVKAGFQISRKMKAGDLWRFVESQQLIRKQQIQRQNKFRRQKQQNRSQKRNQANNEQQQLDKNIDI